MRLSLSVYHITCIMPFLADILHEGLEKGRAAVDGVHAEIAERKEAEAHFVEKGVVDEEQQAVQGLRWEEIHDLFLDLSVTVLLLTVNLISMCPNLHLHLLLDVLCLQFIYQLKMCESSVKMIAEDCNHDSKYLGHDVSPEDSDCYQCENGVYALNGVFRGDIAISDSGDDCYAVVHDVRVHLIPVEDHGHLIEGPRVVHPAEIRGIGAVVIVLVDPLTDHVEEESHVMRVDDAEDYQFDHQVSSVQSNVELGHSLELNIYPAGSPDLGQPDQFHQVESQRAGCQRDYHRDQPQDIYPKIYFQVFPEDEGKIIDEEPLLIVALQRRDEHVCHDDEYENYVDCHEAIQVILPEGFSEGQQQAQFQHVEDYDAHHHQLPHQEADTPRTQLYSCSPIQIHHYLQERAMSFGLRGIAEGLKDCIVESLQTGEIVGYGLCRNEELSQAVSVNLAHD